MRARAEPAPGTWIFGRHAALAAAANPSRRVLRMLAQADGAPLLAAAAGRSGVPRPAIEIVDRPVLSAFLPEGAVHQGFAVAVTPLPVPALDDLLAQHAPPTEALVVVLDQASDPRNVGAVLRSAAAFAAAAVVVQDRHAPVESGALAKAASGALEAVPMVRVVNIARALRALAEAGFLCLGLDSAAEQPITGQALPKRIALVIGAEGAGLRRLTKECCERLARIPIAPAVESLNVSVAAAIALFAVRSQYAFIPNS
jgi:23S rRNA (guanosine2251-2'-O)-methyltransferase